MAIRHSSEKYVSRAEWDDLFERHRALEERFGQLEHLALRMRDELASSNVVQQQQQRVSVSPSLRAPPAPHGPAPGASGSSGSGSSLPALSLGQRSPYGREQRGRDWDRGRQISPHERERERERDRERPGTAGGAGARVLESPPPPPPQTMLATGRDRERERDDYRDRRTCSHPHVLSTRPPESQPLSFSRAATTPSSSLSPSLPPSSSLAPLPPSSQWQSRATPVATMATGTPPLRAAPFARNAPLHLPGPGSSGPSRGILSPGHSPRTPHSVTRPSPLITRILPLPQPQPFSAPVSAPTPVRPIVINAAAAAQSLDVVNALAERRVGLSVGSLSAGGVDSHGGYGYLARERGSVIGRVREREHEVEEREVKSAESSAAHDRKRRRGESVHEYIGAPTAKEEGGIVDEHSWDVNSRARASARHGKEEEIEDALLLRSPPEDAPPELESKNDDAQAPEAGEGALRAVNAFIPVASTSSSIFTSTSTPPAFARRKCNSQTSRSGQCGEGLFLTIPSTTSAKVAPTSPAPAPILVGS